MSNPEPERYSGALIDLSPRVARTATVVASPADNTETIIASVTVNRNVQAVLGVLIIAQAAYTVGTSGTSVNLKIRKTDASGSTLYATGAVDIAATKLGDGCLIAVDTSPTLPGQVYVLTMTVASGAATSTVSATQIFALVI